MKLIHKVISFILVVAVTAAIMIYASLRGEKAHQADCAELGLNCEPGQVSQTTEQVEHWWDKFWAARSRAPDDGQQAPPAAPPQ